MGRTGGWLRTGWLGNCCFRSGWESGSGSLDGCPGSSRSWWAGITECLRNTSTFTISSFALTCSGTPVHLKEYGVTCSSH